MNPLRRMLPSNHALFVFEAVARNRASHGRRPS